MLSVLIHLTILDIPTIENCCDINENLLQTLHIARTQSIIIKITEKNDTFYLPRKKIEFVFQRISDFLGENFWMVHKFY